MKSFAGVICFPGITAEVFNPGVVESDGLLHFSFDIKALRALMDLAFDRLKSDGQRPVLAPVPASSSVLPYVTSEGSVVFVAAGSEGGTAAIAGNSAKKKDSQSRQIRCAVEGCG